MRLFPLYTLALTASLLVCCKDIDEPSETKPSGGSEGKDVRVELTLSADALMGEWAPGDSVSVFDNTGNHTFKTASGGASAKFTGDSYARALVRTIVYPADHSLAMSGGSVSFSPVTEVQGNPVHASAACGSGGTYSMQPLLSALEFTVVSSDVESVTVTAPAGKYLTGKVTVSSANGKLSVSYSGSGRRITLLPPEGSEFLEAGKHTISCLPGDFGSLTVTAVRAGDRASQIETSAVSVAAGGTASLGAVEDGSLPDLAPVDINLVFYSNTFTWPFTSPAASELSSSVGTASFPGVEKNLVLPESEGGYVLKAKCTTGLCRHSTQGFRFGGGVGDYIDFPAIQGLFLNSVTIVSGNASNAMQISSQDGSKVTGGNISAIFTEAGQIYTWNLYGAERGGAYRLVLVSASYVGIREIHLHYGVSAVAVPTGPVSLRDYGFFEATTGEQRYNILFKAHTDALVLDREIEYSGVGTVDLEIPSNATTIPIGEHTDFKGTVFHVTNKGKKLYLFTRAATRKKITVTGAQIDNADYHDVPELSSGLYLLSIQDDSLWVRQREGRDYGATRKEVLLVRDGSGSNGPVAPYSTPATRISASYCPTTDDQKSFGNVTLDRDVNSTFMTHLVKIDGQNNFRLHNITVNTPVTDWNGDACISITNCTNTLCEDITFNGTYSQTNLYGYGLSCNNIWNTTFRRITSHCPWGVFGNNNTHDSLLEDSDVERFDTHCYGRNITVRNCTLTGRGIPVSSIFGTILLEHTKLVKCYPYSIRADYNSYVDLDVVIRDCEMTGTSAWIFPMGRLDNIINERPELAEKRWPDVTIDGLSFEVPSGAAAVYLFRPSTKNSYGQPLGKVSKVNIKGLEFKYPSGVSKSVPLYISSQAAQASNSIRYVFDNLELSAPGATGPVPIYINLHGPSDTYSAVGEGITVVSQ